MQSSGIKNNQSHVDVEHGKARCGQSMNLDSDVAVRVVQTVSNLTRYGV